MSLTCFCGILSFLDKARTRRIMFVVEKPHKELLYERVLVKQEYIIYVISSIFQNIEYIIVLYR